ncbi:MAG: hypothetical protein JWO56_1063 [Acidobacteria bacterium]|nr:hypothetical protein [Acidobacteriota bacterium]
MPDPIVIRPLAAADPLRPPVSEVLKRGWHRRCPRCGEGPLFLRGIRFHARCTACNLLYQRDRGDTWMFMIITDRVPILFGIAAVYFGFHPTTPLAIGGFIAALAIPVLATLRNRQGLALACDYLVRVHFPDPSDEIHGGRSLAAVASRPGIRA